MGASATAVDGAAYDPEGDTWRELPETDFRTLYRFPLVEWSGTKVLAVDSNPQLRGVSVGVYDPGANTWSLVWAPGFRAQAIDSAVLGGQLYLASYMQDLDGIVSFDPGTGAWGPPRQLHGSCENIPTLVATDSELFFSHCDAVGLYDPRQSTWEPLPTPGGLEPWLASGVLANTVWTGRSLLTWDPGLAATAPAGPERPSVVWTWTPN